MTDNTDSSNRENQIYHFLVFTLSLVGKGKRWDFQGRIGSRGGFFLTFANIVLFALIFTQ